MHYADTALVFLMVGSVWLASSDAFSRKDRRIIAILFHMTGVGYLIAHLIGGK